MQPNEQVETPCTRYPSRQAMKKQIMKILQTNSFNDNIFVESLGVGIDRGWMALGRLPSSQLVPYKDQSCQDQEAEIGLFEHKDAEMTKSMEHDEVSDIGLD